MITINGNDTAPTPYCIDGIATAVMALSGEVELWANDFDAGSFDNCEGDLVLSMIPEIDAEGLSIEEAYSQSYAHENVVLQANGDYGWRFDCSYIPNGISSILEVRFFVTDVDGNYDYCTASLRIDDNLDACLDDTSQSSLFNVSGSLKTEVEENIENVEITVDASFPEFPSTEIVDNDYAFNLLENIDYTVIPIKNDDLLNGISTADIILLQKHILGLKPLDSPYKMIAADVNKDCKVNGQDIIQIRKLLLGKYPNDEFPQNTSWRFIESEEEFFQGVIPCDFAELTTIENLSEDVIQNYIGAKIGDLNGSANANLKMNADTRNDEVLTLIIDESKVFTGEPNFISVYAKDFTNIYGIQFTVEFDGVFEGIDSEVFQISENNYRILDNTLSLTIDIPAGKTV